MGTFVTKNGVRVCLAKYKPHPAISEADRAKAARYFSQFVIKEMGGFHENCLISIVSPTHIVFEAGKLTKIKSPGHISGVLIDASGNVVCDSHIDFLKDKPVVPEKIIEAEYGHSSRDIPPLATSKQTVGKGKLISLKERLEKELRIIQMLPSQADVAIVITPGFTPEYIENIKLKINKLHEEQPEYRLSGSLQGDPFNCGIAYYYAFSNELIHLSASMKTDEEYNYALFRATPIVALLALHERNFGREVAFEIAQQFSLNELFTLNIRFSPYEKALESLEAGTSLEKY